MINPDYFCAMAYNGIGVNHNGSLDPCCQYLPSQQSSIKFYDYKAYVETVRQEMHDDHMAGRRHAGCRKCWQEEDLGLKSLRHYANEVWYKDTATPVVSEDNPLLDVELRFGNLCNLKCIMCDPKASSALNTERTMNADLVIGSAIPGVRVLSKHEHELNWWESTEFAEFSKKLFSHAKRVNITGGEPFMIPETVNALDLLLPRKDDVTISFNTNLTKLPVAITERLAQFPKVSLSVSLEGIGTMAEYLRYPCVWDDVDANIQTVLKLVSSKRVYVNHTLQHGSIYSLPALAEYCHKLDMPMNFTTVQGIECLKLNSVPKADCEKFLQWLDQTDSLPEHSKTFLKNAVQAAEFDLAQYNDFRKYVKLLDQIRGTDYDQVFNPSKRD